MLRLCQSIYICYVFNMSKNNSIPTFCRHHMLINPLQRQWYHFFPLTKTVNLINDTIEISSSRIQIKMKNFSFYALMMLRYQKIKSISFYLYILKGLMCLFSIFHISNHTSIYFTSIASFIAYLYGRKPTNIIYVFTWIIPFLIFAFTTE